ncbi:MAG: hypothetical protein A2Z88_08245 [Omnitrophica WOR_2 bacterium GWA2_47_8]|nr:MAG: hypothetical protein A2Z88_08245 [Omnitrophica WOR_2 bacterium GWA2_47_8]
MKSPDKRKYDRYDTEVKVYFYVNYEVKTKVDYQVLDKKQKKLEHEKHHATTRDVSAQGMCFLSNEKLNKGDWLYLEVYVPKSKKPIPMEGEVRWSENMKEDKKEKSKFYTGVQLKAVNGIPVDASIYFDESYRIVWSAVLESILGNFRKFAQKREKIEK